MIRIKIDLISARGPEHSKNIGCMYLANKGSSDDGKRGDYVVAVCKRGSELPPIELYAGTEVASRDCVKALKKATRVGEVLNYPRLSYNVWRLVSRALRSAFPEEG